MHVELACPVIYTSFFQERKQFKTEGSPVDLNKLQKITPKLQISVQNKGENPVLKSVLQVTQFCPLVTGLGCVDNSNSQTRKQSSSSIKSFYLGLWSSLTGEGAFLE